MHGDQIVVTVVNLAGKADFSGEDRWSAADTVFRSRKSVPRERAGAPVCQGIFKRVQRVGV